MFTQEKINTLSEMYIELEKIKEDLDNAYEPVSFTAKDKEYTLVRNGKEVKETEDVLWYEVRNLGRNCEAGKILEPIYPQIFELSDLYNVKVQNISAYSMKELKLDPLKISFIDIIRIVDGITEMKMKNV